MSQPLLILCRHEPLKFQGVGTVSLLHKRSDIFICIRNSECVPET